MIKERWNTINSKFSAPLLCYFLLALLAIVFIGTAMYDSFSNAFRGIISNLGYGIFCSTFVAALIDFSTKKRQEEKDKKAFITLTEDMKTSIRWLISIRTIWDQQYKEEIIKDNYQNWIMLLISFSKKGNKSAKIYVSMFFDILSSVLLFAKDLRKKTVLIGNNQYLPENFWKDLDYLIHYMIMFDKISKNNIGMCYLLVDKILNTIVCLYPEFKNALLMDWDSSEMIQQFGVTISDEFLEMLKNV